MLRAIREIRPRFIVGENVYGFVNWNGGMVFDQVQIDLENEGYEVQTVILPACAVNAPHRRDRCWIVAYSESTRTGEDVRRVRSIIDGHSKGLQKKTTASDTRLFRPEKSKEQTARIEQCDKGNVTDEGSFGWIQNNKQRESGESEYACSSWERFPTQSPVCSRNDGVSDQLDGITFPKWRVESIKAYGNAIVPQVAFQIFKAIVESTKNNH